MRRWLVHLRRTLAHSLSNDVLMLARAGAYSAILCIFPIVLLTGAVIASSPAAEMVREKLRAMLYQMFPRMCRRWCWPISRDSIDRFACCYRLRRYF